MLTYLIKKVNWLPVIIMATVFLCFFWFFGELTNSIAFLYFTEVPFLDRIQLLVLNVAEGFMASSTENKAISIIVSALAGLHTNLFLNYFITLDKTSLRSGVESNIGFILTMIGFGCGACGGVLLTYLSFITGAYTSLIADTNLISYLGVLLMIFSTYRLLKNLTNQYVCEVA